jgi:hypothetical protein
MTTYIPRLARIGKGWIAGHPPSGDRPRDSAVRIDRLKRRLPHIRQTLAIGSQFSDDALLASLVSIVRYPTNETRWHAAEASTLGQYLAGNGRDMHRTLVTLLSLLPEPAL